MKLITLFSGVGMQEQGIIDLNIPYELINYCEYDSKIANCFNIIHNVDNSKNIGDITKLDVNKYYTQLKKEKNTDIDVITSSFPCQSFSIAGKKKGFEDEKNGSLYDYQYKLIKKIKPKIVIYENVKNITNSKFGAVEKITNSMEQIGYTCFHKVLNSLNFGIPQNRERWFMVCIKDYETFENEFNFPQHLELNTCVKDYIIENDNRSCCSSMKSYFEEEFKKTYRSSRGMKKVFDGVEQKYFKSGFTTHRIYSIEGISPTFTTSNDCHFYELKGKLSSKERWGLMGMKDNDHTKLVNEGVAEGLINKICGNGIVVDVFRELFREVNKFL
jgi:DNA-cytosine methyltransferase